MTLGIQDIVEVRAQITPRGAGGREFGRTLLLTTDPTLDAGAGRVGVFASMDEVARTFTPGSGPYQAAQVYFSQVPYPRNLVIGRWINTREPARLTGGSPRALEQITGRATVVRGSGTVETLANIKAIMTGTVTFLGSTASGITFASAADMDGVATLLQAALRGTSEASLDAVEVTYDGTQFVVTLPLSSDGSATEVSDPFTGASADELGLDTVDITAGVDGIGAGSLTWHGSSISVDFTSATSYDDVASTLQTALRAVRTAARADFAQRNRRVRPHRVLPSAARIRPQH